MADERDMESLMMSDERDIVEITIHETKLLFEYCTYPEPTREQIADKLKETIFSYSEKRTKMLSDSDIYERYDGINLQNSGYLTARINEQRQAPPSHTYNKDSDPFNE